MPETVTKEQIFSILADKVSLSMLKMAYSGVKVSPKAPSISISKKQFYVRLKRLRDAGLIEKRDSFYRTTTLGSLIYNGQVKTIEEALLNYWQLKAIDILKAKHDFPVQEKDVVIREILQSTNLRGIVNGTYLSGFNIVKSYTDLIHELIKLLENAQSEIYIASRYHDPFVSNKIIEKFGKGIKLSVLDGNPPNVNLESRLNAILKVPPNKETFDIVSNLVKSPRFNFKTRSLPISFVVVDGIQCGYEVIDHASPEEFTMGIVNYDDPYLAQKLISYYESLEKGASPPKFLSSKLETR